MVGEQTRLAAEQAELEALEEPTPPEGDSGEDEARAQTLTTERDQLAGAMNQARDRITALERDLHDVRTRLNAYEQAKTRFESQQAELQRQLSDTDKALDEQDTGTVDVGTLRDTLATAQDALAQDEQTLATAQKQLEARHAHHADAHAEAQAQRRRAQRADAALRARQGYAQGPRHALSADIDGVIGSVADLLDVPERYTTAVASALGRRAEHVVVEDADVAKRVLAWVKQRGGWVTLLPLDLLYGRRSSLARDFASETGVIGLAADLVDINSRYSVVPDNLLGTTAVVEDNDVAVYLARNYRQRPRLVTLAGEIVESYGAMSGGKREGSVGVFGLKQEAEQAEVDAAVAEQAARDALEALEAARAAQQQAREQYAARQKRVDELQTALAAQRETRAAARAIQQDLVTRRDQLRQRLAALIPPDPPADTDQDGLIVRLEKEQEGLEHLTHQRDTVLSALRDLDQQRAVYKEQQQRYQDAKTRYDEARQRLVTNRAQQQRLAEQRHDADTALANAQQALADANAALPTDLAALEATVKQTQQTLRDQDARLETLAQQQAERGAALEQCRIDLARRDAALEPATETLQGFPEGIEPLDGTLPALRNRLKDVDDALERLGPVNYRAETDLLREQAEVDTLAEQHADTEAAVDELADALADIDQDVTQRIERAAVRLRDDFGDYVRHLFGADAHADVALSYNEGRPDGVGLELRPPGKQTRSLGLLSVGERTMGALAFLFALTRQGDTGGLPLAVLDEVDAPLDEANIRRFCGFLQQLAREGTQFVLITHQKATMEVADVLWGVTSDAGISRLFSIRQEDVPNNIPDGIVPA
ncbi:MAG: chromosome segregation SMC family protein [Trueperaceae bacterium]|nr:chromosome segregation SMC family protein [Trueperaceae bacterium]